MIIQDMKVTFWDGVMLGFLAGGLYLVSQVIIALVKEA